MMNNQNTSGSDRMSENNNLNPQTNSGNINSSERPNINSILNVVILTFGYKLY